nr:hypothetical protein BdHM001_36310 [Bdellovibrio sp. HM001]
MDNDKTEPEMFIGYVETERIPFKKGDVILIPAGTKVKSTNPSKREYLTKRKQRIKVFSVDTGSDMDEALYSYEIDRHGADENAPVIEREVAGSMQRRRVTSNPSIVFTGSGGYWCHVEVRDILAANKKD